MRVVVGFSVIFIVYWFSRGMITEWKRPASTPTEPRIGANGETIYPDGSIIPAKQVEASAFTKNGILHVGNYGSWDWPAGTVVINGEFEGRIYGVKSKGGIDIPLMNFSRSSDGLRFQPTIRDVVRIELRVDGKPPKIIQDVLRM